MAREILFRGKRIDNGEWVNGYVTRIKRADDNGNAESYYFNALDELGWVAECTVSAETVCQYTGLADKNGRKIFDGDIVKDRSCDLYTVNWSDENGMYEVRQYGCSMASFETFFACDCEVIGNIFDNPELMEED
ncbi:MAG: hypothetical protein HDR08_01665 [Lachnospiraceae bacterium]|nr:hypothetical protein [Lachnospiraceae bacterium]